MSKDNIEYKSIITQDLNFDSDIGIESVTPDIIVDYRNGIVSNAIQGQIATLDFEAKINIDTDIKFTVNWGDEIGTTIIEADLVDDVWKSFQTNIFLPVNVFGPQQIIITDDKGSGYAVNYDIIPIFEGLNTYHKTITDKTFAESINNLPAKFIPRVARFNGIDNYCRFNDGGDLNPIGNFTWAFDYIQVTALVNKRIFSNSVSLNGFELYSVNGRMLFRVYTAAGHEESYIQASALTLNVKYSIVITKSSDTYTAYIDEIAEIPVVFAAPILVETSNLYIGASTIPNNWNAMHMANLKMYSRALSLSEIEDIENTTNGLLVFIPDLTTGYDVSANNQHLTVVDVTIDYNELGTLYLNSQGYSLWQHATLEDIQVPFDINGLPINLIPGTNIPTGYIRKRDLLPSSDKHNIYDSLINFNPTGLLDTELDIFDRSNITIQTSASRASIYYDGTDRTTSSIYHISEIVDPVIYDTFFEVASKNTIFGKVLLDISDNIIRYDEELNYSEQQTGDELLAIEEYCNIENIYP